jgi:antitoxin component of MazEF toxin-antitoxin module
MRQKVIKTGHSAAVTIPSEFAHMIGIKIGDMVKVDLHPETGKMTCTFEGAYQLLLTNDILKKQKR